MKDGTITIRETASADLAEIVRVHKEAFGYDKEAELTAELLGDASARPYLSLNVKSQIFRFSSILSR